jgi:hypothetical protein
MGLIFGGIARTRPGPATANEAEVNLTMASSIASLVAMLSWSEQLASRETTAQLGTVERTCLALIEASADAWISY